MFRKDTKNRLESLEARVAQVEGYCMADMKQNEKPSDQNGKTPDMDVVYAKLIESLDVSRFGRNGDYKRYVYCISRLCNDFKEELYAGRYVLVDANLYAVNAITSCGVRVFENVKQLGVTNLDKKGTHSKNVVFVDSIQVLYGNSKDGYGRIPHWMENGELMFGYSYTTHIAMLSMQEFANSDGIFTLTTPAIMKTNEHYEMRLDWQELTEVPTDEIKVVLRGLMLVVY